MSKKNIQLFQHHFSAMGCPCVFHFYSTADAVKSLFKLCEQEVMRFHKKYSRYDKNSALSQINHQAGTSVKLDKETAAIIDYADKAYTLSDGLFDITSAVFRSIWDFKNDLIPKQKDIDALLPYVGWDKVEWQNTHLRLPKKMQIDFGGIVKEYAADVVANKARHLGVEQGLVDLGGDLAVIGAHPSGKPWNIGIRDPEAPSQIKAEINILQGGLATSGDYERFFIMDNKRYCHIINPKTGWPAQGVAGVSVMAPLCVLAGTLSTVAMLKGNLEGHQFLKALELPYLLFERL
ncbi:MAG: FAD:protein FMN transferase [Pseudomonadota bacterium]